MQSELSWSMKTTILDKPRKFGGIRDRFGEKFGENPERLPVHGYGSPEGSPESSPKTEEQIIELLKRDASL